MLSFSKKRQELKKESERIDDLSGMHRQSMIIQNFPVSPVNLKNEALDRTLIGK